MITCSRAALALLLCCISLQAQQTLNTPSPTYPTIQSAINAAADGDTVQIAAGTFMEHLVLTKSLTLEGAGANLTLLDGALSGRCLDINLPTNATATIRNLEVRRGFASGIAPIMPGIGGGILFRSPAMGTSALNIEYVNFRDCKAFKGAGLSTPATGMTMLLGSHFVSNKMDLLMGVGTVGGNGVAIHVQGTVLAEGCTFLNNNATPDPNPPSAFNGIGGAIHVEAGADCVIRGCIFDGNRARFAGAISAGTSSISPSSFQLSVENSIFRNNVAVVQFGVIQTNGDSSSSSLAFLGCLFHDNSSQIFPSEVARLKAKTILISDSIAANNNANSTIGFGSCTSEILLIENSIFSGNGNGTDTGDLIASGTFSGSSATPSWTIRNSLLSKSNDVANFYDVATGIIEGIPAGFVDAGNGDFHLLPGSPAVDAGLVSVNQFATDLDGLPRNQLVAPDMGCFELQPGQEDPGANWSGTVPDLMSGFEDVLLVNGTAGDAGRRINTAIGSMTTIAVDAAPGTLSGNFIIWGRIGLPGATEAFPIPFAQGSMAFVPHILAVGNPSLFTFASTSLPGGIFAASPAPWSVTGSSLPFPLTITLQGLIETGGSNVRLTNAVAIHNF